MVHMYQRRRVLVSFMTSDGWKKEEGRTGISEDMVTGNLLAEDSKVA